MIKIWTENDSKITNNLFFNVDEIKILNRININSNNTIRETDKKINDYILKKYNLKGLFEVDDTDLDEEDKEILELKNKISESLERIV